MAIVLGLDLSTQSATALVLDTAKGTTVARARAAFGADFPDRGHPEGFLRGGKGGEVHADPLLWLDGLELALDRLARLTDLSRVDAVSVFGQQHGSVYLAAGYEAALADGDRATSLSAKIAPVLSLPLFADLDGFVHRRRMRGDRRRPRGRSGRLRSDRLGRDDAFHRPADPPFRQARCRRLGEDQARPPRLFLLRFGARRQGRRDRHRRRRGHEPDGHPQG
jgi:hypothetical protein